jgi:hypothetical protein
VASEKFQLEAASLWRARVAVMHNEILSSNAEELCTACLDGYASYIAYYKTLAADLPEDLKQMHSTNLALLLAEQSIPAIQFWKYELCEEGISEALSLLGIAVEFEGKLGRRTKWQQFDVAQLMLDVSKTDASM